MISDERLAEQTRVRAASVPKRQRIDGLRPTPTEMSAADGQRNLLDRVLERAREQFSNFAHAQATSSWFMLIAAVLALY